MIKEEQNQFYCHFVLGCSSDDSVDVDYLYSINREMGIITRERRTGDKVFTMRIMT